MHVLDFNYVHVHGYAKSLLIIALRVSINLILISLLYSLQVQKLKSTYVDGMMSAVVSGYLSTHWDQTSAATGRLSSHSPNIQAIPKTASSISVSAGKDKECIVGKIFFTLLIVFLQSILIIIF